MAMETNVSRAVEFRYREHSPQLGKRTVETGHPFIGSGHNMSPQDAEKAALLKECREFSAPMKY